MAQYPYSGLPSKFGPIFKPIIPVQLRYAKTHKITLPTTALIDSGADVCFCADYIGIWLGIAINKIKKVHSFTAANGGQLLTKSTTVTLHVAGKKYDAAFHFCDTLPKQFPLILGQVGFFDNIE